MKKEKMEAKARMLIESPVEKVFDAFVDRQKISSFWFSSSSENLRENSVVYWTYRNDGEDFDIRVCIKEFKLEELIVFDWQTETSKSEVRLEFSPYLGNSTVITGTEVLSSGTSIGATSKMIDAIGNMYQMLFAAKVFLETGQTMQIAKGHGPR